MKCRDIALGALDGEWRSETEIVGRIGSACSRSGLRHGLTLLASEKRADMKEAPANSVGRARVFVYRLAQAKP